jgi:hypothetical protein
VLSLTPVRHSTQDPRSHVPTSNITDLVVVVLLLSSVWYDSGHFRAARAAVSEPWPRPVLPTPKPGEACRVHSTATTSPVTRRIGEALRRAAVPVNPLWHVHACLFLVVTLELRGQGGLHGCATAKSRTSTLSSASCAGVATSFPRGSYEMSQYVYSSRSCCTRSRSVRRCGVTQALNTESHCINKRHW